jgi:hypothetical protein
MKKHKAPFQDYWDEIKPIEDVKSDDWTSRNSVWLTFVIAGLAATAVYILYSIIHHNYS